MKTRIFFLSALLCLSLSKSQAQSTSPEHIKNLSAILKKPVPSGSTLRYENLMEYISTSLDETEAGNVYADIKAQNTFGKYFYSRLSHSTVDKKILPLLKRISGGQRLEPTISEEKSQKSKPKSSSTTPKAESQGKKGEAATSTLKKEINTEDLFIVKRFPFSVAFPQDEIYKNANEEDIMRAVFQNQPAGVSFVQISDKVWQMKFTSGNTLDFLSEFLEFVENKNHYFVPHIARDLFEIEPDLLWVHKVNEDEFQITYAKNLHLGFTQMELLNAITKHDKLPDGMKIIDIARNQWRLKISDRGVFQSLVDKTIGFDLSEFEEDFAKKIMAAAK